MALNLVIWGVAGLVYLPSIIFSLYHPSGAQAPASAYQIYLYRYDFISLIARMVSSAGLFLAAVWVYGCGPTITRFLSADEE